MNGADREDLFRRLFETAPDAMVVVDASGSIVLANPQAERLFGYPAGGMPGLKIEALIPPEVRGAHVGHRDAYMQQPRVRPMGAGYELTGLRRNGERFPVEIGLSPITSSDGPLFSASIRDISETQRARQALTRARYDAYLARVGRLVLEAPDLTAAIAGMPALLAEALDVPVVALAFGNRERGSMDVRASTPLSAALADALPHALVQDPGDRQAPVVLGQAPAGALPLLRHALAQDGLADAVLVPLLDRYESMGLLMVAAREARSFDHDRLNFLQLAANMLAAAMQRSRSEEQLAHAQRLDALGQLTGGIAHDFNNLLTIVSGNLQLLEAELHGDAELHAVMDSASRAVERCNTLTRKLLGFARRRALVAQPVRPDQVLGDLEDMLARTLGARIVVTVDCPTNLPHVYADAGELDAALVNLALNARDAMPEGGLLRITVRQREIEERAAGPGLPPGRYVAFTVADTGSGMSAEVRARALEPFFTTKDGGKGSGLGLSMVYGFVKQSGGHLEIESEPGYGTRIELLIPAIHADARGAAARPAARLPSSAQETVLVVEDEPDVRKIAVAFLRRQGHAVLEAHDAEAALDLLGRGTAVDLLFTDVMLGSGMTGFELAQAARALRPELPILLASGFEHAASGAQETPPGEYELLRKPYRREQMIDAVRRALDRRR